MRKRCLFILIFSFIVAAVSASAQTRTITNADLEKFRQKRLEAERDLRENYQRLGFPSPEELERQIEQSRQERAALSARIEAENLQREQLNIERRRAEIEARSLNYQTQTQNYQNYDNGYFYNSPYNGFFSFPNFGYRNNFYNRRGNFGRGNRRFNDQPRYEYRNNIPVLVPPAPRPIFAPRQTNGRRN